MFKRDDLLNIKSENTRLFNHHEALPVGALIHHERYEIIGLEDVSDQTFVYKAHDRRKDCLVTIKEYYPRTALGYDEQIYLLRRIDSMVVDIKDENEYKLKQYHELLNEFIEEAKYVQKIAYKDAVFRVLDIFQAHHTAYVVYNYNEWPTLQDVMDSNYIFSPHQLDWIAHQLLSCVSKFHKRQVVHRNIHPKAIIIQDDRMLLDSQGHCDAMQDIKTYESDDYKSHFSAPEVIMHQGVIGLWTDTYALGKVFIEMIMRMTPEKDYFAGLKALPEEQRTCYSKVNYNVIQFDYEKRLSNAMAMKKALTYEGYVAKPFRTNQMIAMIAMIAIIGCMGFLLQHEGPGYRIIEEESVPLGAPRSHFTMNHMKGDQNIMIQWFISDKMKVIALEIVNEHQDPLNISLEAYQSGIALTHYQLNTGFYQVYLHYTLDDDLKVDSMILEIE